jgi:AbrB family looped-hinge helix DNA binding protein
MQESTVTIKGQTTLPKDVRVALGLLAGDKVRYLILDGGEVRLVRGTPVARLAGLLKGKTTRVVSLDEMDEAIAQAASAP